MSNLWQDLRYAWRTPQKAPGFTVAAVLVLAIGIGANSAIFSLVDAVLLRPLPFPQADRLVMLWEASPENPRHRVSPLNFQDWAEQNRSFAAIAAVAGGRRTLIGRDGVPESITGQTVTTTFFDVLGIRPIPARARPM
jgi:putative ABC transport system permease protein